MVAKESEDLPDLLPEPNANHGAARRIGFGIASVVLFALGIVGWLVPVITGIPFLVLSAITAGLASRRVARYVNARERRLPLKWRRRLRPKFMRKWRRKAVESG